MSDIAVVVGGRAARRDGLDRRRVLQLALAGLWLLDALLQCQPMMFSKAFGEMLAATADGNPGFIARPIAWDATLTQQHAVGLNVGFAAVQLLLGLGIAFRPTARLALAASVAWSAGVWWFGEGLGGVLTSAASPVTGAPGAAILYALLAVLLLARPVSARVARALWLVLWLALAWFALRPANSAPWALSDTLAGMASGEPGWVAALERGAAAVIGGHGLAVSIVLAAAFTLVAVGLYLPRPVAWTALVLAVVIAGMIWVFGEAFGTIMAGGATDPNSGPLLALLALVYFPVRTAPR